MTSGMVIVLGEVSHNVGAGMTGGRLYLPASQVDKINKGILHVAASRRIRAGNGARVYYQLCG